MSLVEHVPFLSTFPSVRPVLTSIDDDDADFDANDDYPSGNTKPAPSVP